MTAREALTAGTKRLEEPGGTARLDAELLMAHAMGISREELLLRRLDDEAPPAFSALIERRLAHEPVAYITGRKAFWTIDLDVGPGVLIPRPDSETLIEAAIDHFEGRAPATILDLGTGPGTLLLAALDRWPDARGLGVDASDTALSYAIRNARRLGMEHRASFRLGDWTEGLEGRFDLILCNPPYVETGAALPPDVGRWEPGEALFAGPDGLNDYRRIAPALSGLLAPDGLACVEIGQGQQDPVSSIFLAEGFIISSRTDLNEVARCLCMRL